MTETLPVARPYEPPRIERILSREDLEREIRMRGHHLHRRVLSRPPLARLSDLRSPSRNDGPASAFLVRLLRRALGSRTALCGSAPRRRDDDGQQFRRIDRLGDERVEAGLEGLHPHVGARVRGQSNRRDVPQLG